MIPEHLIQKAWNQNKYLGGRLKVLSKFDVIGCLKEYEITETLDFLKTENIPYEFNGKFLIWLPELPNGIKKLFNENQLK